MILLDGKKSAEALYQTLTQKVGLLKEKGLRPPHLVAVLVGEDPASQTYVASKVKTCGQIGYQSTLIKFEANVSENELLEKVAELNQQPEVDGILVQLPLPRHISEQKVIETIAPEKDVDGFHPINVGRMAKNLPALFPATPAGILELLKAYNVPTAGKHCVVIGRSNIVGSPMSILMARNAYPGNATVTLCHSKTPDFAEFTRQADIVIVAAGKPLLLKGEHIKEGATVVDVGIHRIEDAAKKSGFRLIGDVDFDSVAPKCAYISPVPGGVGPMTIAGLLNNTFQAYARRNGLTEFQDS